MAIRYIVDTPNNNSVKIENGFLIVAGWASSDGSTIEKIKVVFNKGVVEAKSGFTRLDGAGAFPDFKVTAFDSGFSAKIPLKKISPFNDFSFHLLIHAEKECIESEKIVISKKRILKEKIKAGFLYKKLHLGLLIRGLRYFKKNGFLKTAKTQAQWKAWKKRHGFFIPPKAFGLSDSVYNAQKRTSFSNSIKFSVLVPLYNTPENFLKEMIGSVLLQTYENWELCLADGSDSEHGYVGQICEEISQKDSRIKYTRLKQNGGISENTNAALAMASGDYISLFDHDDLLHPSALFETMKAIGEHDADFIYTDEAKFQSPNLCNIICTNFKPDFSPDYFHGINYICHFTSFKKSLLEKAGSRFMSDYDGAQDYDLFLRLTEQTQKIYHIQKCLYYWRASPSSTAGSAGAKNYTSVAGQKALQEHFKRCKVKADVQQGKVPNTYRVNYEIKGEPLVSILIPNYEHWQTLKKCVDSILNLSTYKNYEIIIIENNSTQKETFDYYDSLKSNPKITVVRWEGKFNYSAINNFGFKHAKGDYILLLNNDIEVITPNWIEEMLMFAQRDDVGAVGAMLYYPSDKIQHGGVVLGIGSVGGHSHRDFQRGSYGYASRLLTVQNYSCVTAACLMVSARIYEEVEGLDEKFEVAFNDVDFCMRIRRAGYLNVWTPFAELYHHESESSGGGDMPEKKARFSDEAKRFQARWAEELRAGDPYYNPNLTLEHEDFSVVGEVFPSEKISAQVQL